MTTNSGAALVKKGHPIRGILWGIMFGLGLAVVLVVTTVISLDLVQIIVVLLVGIAVGVLWSLFGPARAPKGLPPVGAASADSDELLLEPGEDDSAVAASESESVEPTDRDESFGTDDVDDYSEPESDSAETVDPQQGTSKEGGQDDDWGAKDWRENS